MKNDITNASPECVDIFSINGEKKFIEFKSLINDGQVEINFNNRFFEFSASSLKCETLTDKDKILSLYKMVEALEEKIKEEVRQHPKHKKLLKQLKKLEIEITRKLEKKYNTQAFYDAALQIDLKQTASDKT